MTMILESGKEKFVPEFTHRKYHVWVPKGHCDSKIADYIKTKVKEHFPHARFKLNEDTHWWGDGPAISYTITLSSWAEDAEFFFMLKSGVFNYEETKSYA